VLRRLIASNSEQYMQAYPPITGRTRKSRDLFAGVRLEE
jgi:hypothetical protein